MATGEIVRLFRGGHPDLTAHTTGVVVGGTFVNISGDIQSGPGLVSDANGGNLKVATATAGGEVFGVSGHDAASGTKLAVLMPGNIVPMIADGGITAGGNVEVGTAGKPKAIASGVKVGKAVTTATSGNVVYIRIV